MVDERASKWKCHTWDAACYLHTGVAGLDPGQCWLQKRVFTVSRYLLL